MFTWVEHVTYHTRHASAPDWLNGAQRIDETNSIMFRTRGYILF
jgi:hypothetical protein